MKTIKLTKEHKEKLIEMSKVLFSEYHYWEISKKQFIQSHLLGNDFIVYEGEMPDINIHWFEFCMTYLQHELYNELSKLNNTLGVDTWNNTLMGKVYFYTFNSSKKAGHPIDYLYKEFEKLEL